MAVKAQAQVTLSQTVDVSGVTRHYLIQASTATKPAKPTVKSPTGWTTTEPTYTTGSTKSLYACDRTDLTDGTWSWSDVSLSSSYEAAKAAYNKAVAAENAAAATAQHFWADADGAHVSSTGDHDTRGFHQLITSVKNAFMHGTTELMTISENIIELGKNSTSAVIKMCGGKVSVSAITSGNGRYNGVLSGDYGATMRGTTGITSISVDDFQELIWMVSRNLRVNDGTDDISDISMRRFLTAIQPVVLYNGGAALNYDTAPGAGTTGNVRLSESAAAFKELTIEFTLNGSQNKVDSPTKAVHVSAPNGKYVCLDGAFWATSTIMQFRFATVLVSGSSITVSHGGFTNIGGGYVVEPNSNNVCIIRVVGRR